jgi:hypothetical protein
VKGKGEIFTASIRGRRARFVLGDGARGLTALAPHVTIVSDGRMMTVKAIDDIANELRVKYDFSPEA